MKVKGYFTLFLATLLVFSCLTLPAQAADTNTTSATIMTEEVPQEVSSYAQQRFATLIQTATNYAEDFCMPSQDAQEYTLGQPIKIFSTEVQCDYNIYYFPVVYNGDIVAIETVSQSGNVLNASLGEGFSSVLQDLMESSSEAYIIVASEKELVALSLNGTITLEADAGIDLADKQILENDNLSASDFTEIISQANATVYLTLEDLVTANPVLYYDPGAPLESKKLPISGVVQLKSNWCWAAAAKGIIKYIKGETYSQSELVTSVMGSPVDETASIGLSQTLFRNYGLDPKYLLPMEFDYVKSQIGKSDPIFMTLFPRSGVGHAITLVGYERYQSGNNYIVINPSDGRSSAITVPSNPYDVCIFRNGRNFYWDGALTFFR